MLNCHPERYASLHALATKNVSGSSFALVLTSALYLLNSSFSELSLNYLFKGIVVVLLFENKKAKYHFKKVKMEYRLKGITTENIKEKVNGKKLLENDRDFYKTFLTYPLIEKRGKVN